MKPHTQAHAQFVATLNDAAPVAIYHADAAGRLTYANRAYRALFELLPEQSLDDRAHSVHPDDRERVRQAWTDFCSETRTGQLRWRWCSAAGAIRHLSESVERVGAPGVDGFVGVICDVTDYQAACDQLEQLQVEGSPSNPALKQLEADLHLAMLLGHLELHYQPKLEVLTGKIHSAEALIRWRDPQRGLIAPADFIHLAEASRLIGEIGEWVIREACRQARAWQNEGLPPIRIAINLSPAQFRHGDLLSIMRSALQDAALEPQYLEVELTESTVMTDAASSAIILEQLSQMGVLVSVDDFGTGYSSMNYLRRFPVDKLKIDRVFIQEIASRPADASIVRAIIALAHSLKLKVVAEGVETREQLEYLQALKCDQFQGHYFSPAVPAAEFAALLRYSLNKSFMEDVAMRTHSKLSAYRRGSGAAERL